MRAVVQRVSTAKVSFLDVSGLYQPCGEIGQGLVVLIGAAEDDTQNDVDYLVRKICGLRIFEDDKGQMNRDLADIKGSLLVVSQFTLAGDCRKGRRPSFIKAMEPQGAEVLVNSFISGCQTLGFNVESGRFRTTMNVELCNDGPVTMLLDSKKLF